MTYNKQMSYHFLCIHTKQKRTGYIIYSWYNSYKEI